MFLPQYAESLHGVKMETLRFLSFLLPVFNLYKKKMIISESIQKGIYINTINSSFPLCCKLLATGPMSTNTYIILSYDVTVIQWITPYHE